MFFLQPRGDDSIRNKTKQKGIIMLMTSFSSATKQTSYIFYLNLVSQPPFSLIFTSFLLLLLLRPKRQFMGGDLHGHLLSPADSSSFCGIILFLCLSLLFVGVAYFFFSSLKKWVIEQTATRRSTAMTWSRRFRLLLFWGQSVSITHSIWISF